MGVSEASDCGYPEANEVVVLGQTFDTTLVIGDQQFLVRSVNPVVREAKSQQNTGYSKLLLNKAYYGNRSAAADKCSLLTEDLFHRPRRF
jgi:hypothetical protein